MLKILTIICFIGIIILYYAMLKYHVSKILITISILSRGFVNKSKINLILCYCGSGVEHHLGKEILAPKKD